MKLPLLDKINNSLEIKNIDKLSEKVQVLVNLHSLNPTKDKLSKFKSLISSEIFSTLYTEGEISSRRLIDKVVDRKEFSSPENDFLMIEGFANAYRFATSKASFSISNLFLIYSNLSKGETDSNKLLKDGSFFRDDKVYISSQVLGKDYEGVSPENVSKSLTQLNDFLNNYDLDLFLKAIIGHLFFEYIHPYYDFNGRTGRFIPLWLFNNNGRAEDMMYFATAVGNYRETYLSLFKKCITREGEINVDRFVDKILDLLILNQKQYIWYKNLENKYISLSNKTFNAIQKDFIWTLMIKNEKQGNSEAWNKLTLEDKKFIELDLKDSQFSREVSKLIEFGLVQATSTKPIRYKLNDYKLFNLVEEL